MRADVNVIGMLGLGLMGQAMAGRLLAQGWSVFGTDIEPRRLAEFEAAGGRVAENAREMASRCDLVLLSLPDHSVVSEVIGQIGSCLRAGQFILDTTTGDPRAAQARSAELTELGIDYLDAAISGSSVQVAQGEVLVMCGGRREAFDQCQRLLACLAREVIWTGPSGTGAQMKLVSNLVLGLNRVALAEGLVLAESLGLDARQTLSVLQRSMAYSRIMDTKGDKMIAGDFAPQARLAQHLKDVRLMIEASPVTLPMSERHRQILERAVSMGLAELDNSAVIQAIRKP
jgi:3-hydroxyisobutyrate dehydrogenase-like beta-hydroxyacid dehydrogenase